MTEFSPSSGPQTLSITRPDDWHLHLRDGIMLQQVVGHTAAQFGRALVMPNLSPPITRVAQALHYRERILAALPPGSSFCPLMSLYLNQDMRAEEIRTAAKNSIPALKLYPAGATTNSAAGVRDVHRIYPLLDVMQEQNLVLCIHGEVVTTEVDIFDREERFIDTILSPLIDDFPELRMVLEHITTRQATHFIDAAPSNIAATITPHHLLFDRNDMLTGGIHPHLYCLPILKRDVHRQQLLKAATSGSAKYFLGTDSAPHPQHAKESACGCAGIYSAHAALELYAQAFESVNALDKLEGFSSYFGADFYGLQRNTGRVTLLRQPQRVEPAYGTGPEQIIPLCAEETLAWTLRHPEPSSIP